MNIQFSYENQNQNSYLLATFSPLQKMVQYQLQMMTSNEVPGLLNSMKRQSNENILVYYNITSRISLGQILSRRKLSRKEFLMLLAGTIRTWKEMQEYQLESDGLYLQEDYIFVMPDTCEPAFVFLPIYTGSRGTEGLKTFIQGLILKGVVETSSDNFIQILLNVMNEPMFQISNLETCIEQLLQEKKPKKNPDPKPVIPLAPPAPTPPPMPAPPIPPTPVPVKEEPSSPKTKGEKKKTIMLIQAVVVTLAAAVGSFFAFQRSGHYEYIAVPVLIVAALEFVIYRELFVNNKKKDEPEKEKEKKKKVKKISRARGGRQVEIPGNESSVSSAPSQVPPAPTPPPKVEAAPAIPTPPTPVVPQYKVAAVQEPIEEEIEETGFWDPSARQTEIYLEYIGDGSGTKVMFQSGRLLVGRMDSEVDFVVKDINVGKIHAEFFCQDGQCYVQDLNSKNGTYINGSEIRITSNTPYLLTNGDRVGLADKEFVVHC